MVGRISIIYYVYTFIHAHLDVLNEYCILKCNLKGNASIYG